MKSFLNLVQAVMFTLLTRYELERPQMWRIIASDSLAVNRSLLLFGSEGLGIKSRPKGTFIFPLLSSADTHHCLAVSQTFYSVHKHQYWSEQVRLSCGWFLFVWPASEWRPWAVINLAKTVHVTLSLFIRRFHRTAIARNQYEQTHLRPIKFWLVETDAWSRRLEFQGCLVSEVKAGSTCRPASCEHLTEWKM